MTKRGPGRPRKVDGELETVGTSNTFQALTEYADLGFSKEEAMEILIQAKKRGGKEVAQTAEIPPLAQDMPENDVAVTSKNSKWADMVEEGEAVPKRSWADIAKANRDPQNGIPLTYVKPTEVIRFSFAELSIGAKLWDNSLVGMVVGASPSYTEVMKYVKCAWKDMGLGRIHQTRKGIFLFEFKDGDDRARVLEGNWSMYNRFPLLLKPWKAGVSIDDHFDRVPIWIQLPNLKLDLWAPVNLGKMASYVGVPITTDACTANHTRVDFARVLVEVPLAKKLPDEIPMQFGDGPVQNQPVVYEWKPEICSKCGWFGHDVSKCRRKDPTQEKQPEMKKGEETGEEPLKEVKETEPVKEGIQLVNVEEAGGTELGKPPEIAASDQLAENALKDKQKKATGSGQTTPAATGKLHNQKGQVVVYKSPILKNLPEAQQGKKWNQNVGKGNGGGRRNNPTAPNG